MNQKIVWNKIAKPWKLFRGEKPIDGVFKFLNKKHGKILDLGCGSGRHLLHLHGHYQFYGVDFSKEMILLAEKHAAENSIHSAFILSDADQLPFKDHFFDSAIFISTLHCIETPEKRKNALEELFRVLKKGGEVMITVWGRKQERVKNKPKESFIPWTVDGEKYLRYNYMYTQKELGDLLKEVGFKVKSMEENENIIAVVEKQ